MPPFRFILSLSLLLIFHENTAFSQVFPSGISYQAVVRDSNGDELINEAVTIEFSIRKNTFDGPVIFEESHNLIETNQFGLFSVVIGSGVNTGVGFFSSLSDIAWNDDSYFLEVRAAIPGQGQAQLLGVSQLLTVPYALYALKADTVLNEADGDPQNELIEDFYLNGNVLTITENNTDYSVDLGPILGGGVGGDSDNDVTNELITSVTAPSENELSITEGGVTNTYDISPISYATWSKTPGVVYNISEDVGIGTPNPNSTLTLNGSMSMKYVKLNGSLYDMTAATPASDDVNVFLCNVTSQGVTVRLISASLCAGRIYKFRKYFSGANTTNNVSIVPITGEYIDGISSYVMSHTLSEYVTIISDGIGWFLIDHSKD